MKHEMNETNKIKVTNGSTGEIEYRDIDYIEERIFDNDFSGGNTPIPKMADNEIMLVDITGAITIVAV